MANFENKPDEWIFRSQANPKPEKKASQKNNHHIKLWISSVKSLKKTLSEENEGIFRENIIVRYVDIFGTVVDKLSYERANIYMLDDGTGVISCHMKRDESKSEKIDKLKSSAHNDSSFMLISNEGEEGMRALLSLLEQEQSVFTLGDVLQVKGRLSFYKEEWKVYANQIRVIDFDEENYRCIELGHLYKNI